MKIKKQKEAEKKKKLAEEKKKLKLKKKETKAKVEKLKKVVQKIKARKESPPKRQTRSKSETPKKSLVLKAKPALVGKKRTHEQAKKGRR